MGRREIGASPSDDDILKYKAALAQCPRKFDPFTTFKTAGLKHGLAILLFPLLCIGGAYAAIYESGERPTVMGMPKMVTASILVILGLAGAAYVFNRIFLRDESKIHEYLQNGE